MVNLARETIAYRDEALKTMNNANSSSSSIPLPNNEDISIVAFTAEPYPDGHRVKIKLLLSPFQNSPNAVISIFDHENQELVSVNMVSIFSPENDITIHIPGNKRQPGTYRAQVEVFFVEEEETEGEGEKQLAFRKFLIANTSTLFTIQ